MASCPAGHASATDDYCDVCWRAIEGAAPADSAASKPSFRTQVVGPSEVEAGTPPVLCPECGTPRSPDGRFCELDGHDFEAVAPAPPPAPSAWILEVVPDREYYERCAPEGVDFAEDTPVRSFALERGELVVGRRSGSASASVADDRVCGVADPAVSRLHARFVYGVDGCLAVVDEGSTNGTRLNGGEEPLPPGTTVSLTDGDRVHVGAWTTITVHRC